MSKRRHLFIKRFHSLIKRIIINYDDYIKRIELYEKQKERLKNQIGKLTRDNNLTKNDKFKQLLFKDGIIEILFK